MNIITKFSTYLKNHNILATTTAISLSYKLSTIVEKLSNSISMNNSDKKKEFKKIGIEILNFIISLILIFLLFVIFEYY